jgi:hypothetical protein
MHTDQRHPLGVTDTPEPRSARRTINDMLDAGLLDELMDRVDAGELTLTGEGGFLPEMVKAVLERGLAAELTEHLGYERGDPAGRGSPTAWRFLLEGFDPAHSPAQPTCHRLLRLDRRHPPASPSPWRHPPSSTRRDGNAAPPCTRSRTPASEVLRGDVGPDLLVVACGGRKAHRSMVATRGRWSEAGASRRVFGLSVIDAGAGAAGAPALTSPSPTWWVTRWLTKMWSISSGWPR